jgi:hypothetical protein
MTSVYWENALNETKMQAVSRYDLIDVMSCMFDSNIEILYFF